MTIRQHKNNAPSLNGIPLGRDGRPDPDKTGDVPLMAPREPAAAEPKSPTGSATGSLTRSAHRASRDRQPSYYRAAVRRYWAVLLAGLVAGLVLGGIAASTVTPQYRSTSQVFVSFQASDVTPQSTLEGLSFTQQQVVSYADIVASPLVLDPVIDSLGLDEDAESLGKRVESSTRTDTVLIDISVTDQQPVMAQNIADEISATLGDVIADLERPSGDTRLPVQVTTVQPASLPEDPSAPNGLFIVAIGGAVGLSIGFGLSLLLQSRMLDGVFKSGPSVLGRVRKSKLLRR